MTRPRLCAVCHLPANFALVESRPSVHISLNLKVTRFVRDVATYYCRKHIAAYMYEGDA